jgi:hypothetical protein
MCWSAKQVAELIEGVPKASACHKAASPGAAPTLITARWATRLPFFSRQSQWILDGNIFVTLGLRDQLNTFSGDILCGFGFGSEP